MTEDDLDCHAHGCPNRWAVDAGNGRLCSAHAWAPPHDWPAITQGQLDAVTQRILDAQKPKIVPRYIKPDPAKLRRYLSSLADGIRNTLRTPRGWADELRAREEAGELLTDAQRNAWRAVHGRQFSTDEDEA